MSDEARNAIQGKASTLPFSPGPQQGDLEAIPGVDGRDIYVIAYVNCSIFWTQETGAHELHGAIREHFAATRAIYLLGAPTTDESDCAYGGKYNHFARNGSIYWHPDTGPHTVYGEVRDVWASGGWEWGPFGFPVKDQDFESGASACLFQNGALSANGDNAHVGPSVAPGLGRDQVLAMIWRIFDRVVHQSPDNLGLHPHRSLNSVGSTGYDVIRSRNRLLNVTINGFRDNGLLSDTDWSATMWLLLQDKDYGAGLDLELSIVDGSVSTDDGDVRTWVHRAFEKGFPTRIGLPGHPEQFLLAGADFIGAIVLPDGGLKVTFRNTGAGTFSGIILGPNLTKLAQ